MFALIENGAVVKYPYTVTDVRRDNPNVSFPDNPNDEAFAAFGAMRVFFTTPPAFDDATQKLIEGTPTFDGAAQRWEQVWQVEALTADELQAKDKALYDSIVAATQERLDTFAQDRGYDSILSACTYATSPSANFATEGQYCVAQRDATWTKLIQILGEITFGTRPKPSGYADIEPELPPLVWP